MQQKKQKQAVQTSSKGQRKGRFVSIEECSIALVDSQSVCAARCNGNCSG